MTIEECKKRIEYLEKQVSIQRKKRIEMVKTHKLEMKEKDDHIINLQFHLKDEGYKEIDYTKL